jgi:hypothetical protein
LSVGDSLADKQPQHSKNVEKANKYLLLCIIFLPGRLASPQASRAYLRFDRPLQKASCLFVDTENGLICGKRPVFWYYFG